MHENSLLLELFILQAHGRVHVWVALGHTPLHCRRLWVIALLKGTWAEL